MDFLFMAVVFVLGLLVGATLIGMFASGKIEEARMEAFREAYGTASSESIEREAQLMLDMKEDIFEKTEAKNSEHKKMLDVFNEELLERDLRIEDLEIEVSALRSELDKYQDAKEDAENDGI